MDISRLEDIAKNICSGITGVPGPFWYEKKKIIKISGVDSQILGPLTEFIQKYLNEQNSEIKVVNDRTELEKGQEIYELDVGHWVNKNY